MDVHVDQTGCNDESAGIDLGVARASRNLTDGGNAAVLQQEIGNAIEAGCSVYDASVANCDGAGKL
jgi:hypothetical protein